MHSNATSAVCREALHTVHRHAIHRHAVHRHAIHRHAIHRHANSTGVGL